MLRTCSRLDATLWSLVRVVSRTVAWDEIFTVAFHYVAGLLDIEIVESGIVTRTFSELLQCLGLGKYDFVSAYLGQVYR